MKRKALMILVVAALMLPIVAIPAGAATQTQIDQAIQDGLAWLATQQNSDGSFGSGYSFANTAAAVLAFENEGHFPGGGTEYSDEVEKGLDYIFVYDGREDHPLNRRYNPVGEVVVPSLRWEVNLDPRAREVRLDPDQIRRVLINLLDNAMDATEQHGPIVLATRYDPFLRIAVLEVVDQGSGISKDMRERIFEPYTSTKKGGTGLGLAIVKTIVADHNGYIRVRDNKPQGTCFVLEFPIPVA